MRKYLKLNLDAKYDTVSNECPLVNFVLIFDQRRRESQMKAVVCKKYGPPEVLQLQEVEKPTPKENVDIAVAHNSQSRK